MATNMRIPRIGEMATNTEFSRITPGLEPRAECERRREAKDPANAMEGSEVDSLRRKQKLN